MLLIADSGSTKTHWEFIHNGKVSSAYTDGINPFYKSTEQIIADIRNELLPQINIEPERIFFYGAGISQPDKVEIVRRALLAVFPSAKAEVEHDLLAAARATCGNAPGISCILGTGSNSCLYDGKKIADNVPSLGFMLGDEGSGGYFGKKLLQAYYYRELPDDLKKLLETEYDMRKEQVLNEVYGSSTPNQVVAAYADFVTEKNQHPFIRRILENGFREFFERFVFKYAGFKNLPVHFIGSIAVLNKEILHAVMDALKLSKGITLKSPMEGLVKYHVETVNQ